jgi:hypothetical protein
VTCPKCNAETFSDSVQCCRKCGSSFLRRPRAELIPPVPAERVQTGLGLCGATSLGLNNPGREGNRAEKPIEAQWTKIEKVSFGRALFSRVSEHLVKPSARSASDEFPVDGDARASAPLQDRHPPGGGIVVVNLAQVVTCDCAVCGGGFATTPVGERLLLANVTETVCYLFCASCGDQIMSHVQSQEAAKRYAWVWAIPLGRQESA